MAKAVLATSRSVLLPTWISGDVVIEPEHLHIANARLEVPLIDGAVRPDAVVRGLARDVEFDLLGVEIRVHHAVDKSKREILAAHQLSTMEVDLSTLADDALEDANAFRHAVLDNPENRHWIQLSNAPFVAARTDQMLIEIEDIAVSERDILTKAGKPLTVREQSAFLVKPGSRERVHLQIPDEVVGEVMKPYPRGIYMISGRSFTTDQWGALRLRHKVYLDQIRMSAREPQRAQGGLFDTHHGNEGPGFSVVTRDWRGRPSL